MIYEKLSSEYHMIYLKQNLHEPNFVKIISKRFI